ncbi:unnamed protein product [Rotaria sordida]|uniref:N-acetyltransferase domain-containing protein n=1 Tax=Rotaria sordida TaxID=392033 RepID=A0A815FY98_9BILA|nr:unnamed protein product [Rotaria sordida]CAF1591871.1 unnamed protein product [Rotaria sordida]
MENQFILRRADISDIDALSQLAQRTIQETFVEDLCISYPENFLDSYFHSSAKDKTNGELVAYAAVSPCIIDDIPHSDVCSNKDGALHRLYVRRDRQSHGFGPQLMNVSLSWFTEHFPKRSIWLRVLSQNLKAQKFYSYYGFHKVGDCDYVSGEWKDHHYIMKRQPDTV